MNWQSTPESSEVTALLHAWRSGDESAMERLMPLVYSHLRAQARRYVRYERDGLTLQGTALVHEAFVRLAEGRAVDWRDRSHFYAVASQVMRRILVDAARARGAAKRGAGAVRAQVVELRYFGGLSVEETADVLNVSPKTVMRDWQLAKAWLMRELRR